MAYVAAGAADPSTALLQYGAIGAIALLALYAVAKLFAMQVKAHAHETERADKAEAQLTELNALIRDQIVVQLTRATDAIAHVTELLHERRR